MKLIHKINYYPYTIFATLLGMVVAIIGIFVFKNNNIFPHALTIAVFFAFGFIIDNRMNILKERSRIDHLTKLYNSQHFWNVLGDNIEQMSLIMIDIDFFKDYNDTYGHLAGNDMLQNFGFIMKEYFEEFGLSFRFGGEEFIAILPKIDNQQALTITLKFKEKLNKYKTINSVSIGLVTTQGGAPDISDVFKKCDMAMYKAKEKRDAVYNGGYYRKDLNEASENDL